MFSDYFSGICIELLIKRSFLFAAFPGHWILGDFIANSDTLLLSTCHCIHRSQDNISSPWAPSKGVELAGKVAGLCLPSCTWDIKNELVARVECPKSEATNLKKPLVFCVPWFPTEVPMKKNSSLLFELSGSSH